MKNVVGGIFYRPQKNQNEELDIYGNVIDWSDIRSYTHDPVRVDTPTEVSGYQKQYQYGDRTLNTGNTETTFNPIQNDTPTSDVRESNPIQTVGIIPTSGTMFSTPQGSHKIESGVKVGEMQAFLDEAAKYGVYFRVTSGLRPGATTSSGKTSWHSSGDALDITPIDGQTWDDLKSQFRNNPELIAWMQNNGYGILDETTEEMRAKTGGTGAHFHIGKDNIALEGLKQFIV